MALAHGGTLKAAGPLRVWTFVKCHSVALILGGAHISKKKSSLHPSWTANQLSIGGWLCLGRIDNDEIDLTFLWVLHYSERGRARPGSLVSNSALGSYSRLSTLPIPYSHPKLTLFSFTPLLHIFALIPSVFLPCALFILLYPLVHILLSI